MTSGEKDQSNLRMLWYVVICFRDLMPVCRNVFTFRFFVHGNIVFSAAENPFLLKWVHSLRPSYTPATRYVSMERYLPAEETRVFNEDIKRLEGRNNLTYLLYGWEDGQRRSVYGSLIAEVSQFPIVLGLEELSGVRATADHLVQVSNRALTNRVSKLLPFLQYALITQRLCKLFEGSGL
jgi:hypothetical protein